MTTRIMCGDPIGVGDNRAAAGCLMRFKSRPERVLLLTAMHALVGLRTQRGALVPAADGTAIGTLSAWSGLEGLTTVDAAFVWIDPARVDPQLRGLGALAGVNDNPPLRSILRLADGRSGAITEVGTTLPVQVTGPDWSEQRDFGNQIICEPFTRPSDSGAVVVDAQNRVVGIVAAGGASNRLGAVVTVINPIAAVMDKDLWDGEELQLVTVMPAEAIAPSGLDAPIPDASPPPTQPVPLPPSLAIDVERRDTDRTHLHPRMRTALAALEADLKEHGVPLRLFEAYRAPERQQALFRKGRDANGATVDKSKIVTFAPAWQSYHQYGLAVDMVIDSPPMNPFETASAEAKGFWATYHQLAKQNGLEPLAFELVHVQLAGLTPAKLLAGSFPDGIDESWADNLDAAISRWPGSAKPPRLSQIERPPLLANTFNAEVAAIDWASLPRVNAIDFHGSGGQQWRVDTGGVFLKSVADGRRPLRSPGPPDTCSAILAQFHTEIAAASHKHGVPPELLIMTIATETAFLIKSGFTGPASFRWEAGISDYSAGPMQVLRGTALRLNKRFPMGFADADLPVFESEPNPAPAVLRMYEPGMSLDFGAAMIRSGLGTTGTDPILVAAAYNAGSLQPSGANLWHLRATADHLDRAAQWFGDACAVLQVFGR